MTHLSSLTLPSDSSWRCLTSRGPSRRPPHGSLEWTKGASLCCRCVLGLRQLPLYASLLMSASRPSLTHISKFDTVLILPRYQTGCHKDVSSPGTAHGPSQLFSIFATFSFLYLFFSFRCFCVTWDLRAWIRNESGGRLFSLQPWPTVCTTDPNDPGKPLSDGLSPARASQSSLSRCSPLLLPANEICVTLCFCPHSAAPQRVARQPANILFS